MKINFNGKELTVQEACSVRSLLELQAINPNGIAVAINQNIVPKDKWDNTSLNSNDNLLIIKATQGG